MLAKDGDEAWLDRSLSPPPPTAPAAASASANGSAVTGRGSQKAALPASGQPSGDLSTRRFRTIQDCPKDLSILIWQVERTGEPASNREGHAMDERTTDRRSKK
jgi:hypothetical protein